MNVNYTIPGSIAKYVLKCSATGSRVICNPAPTNTDEDYILLVRPNNFENLDEAFNTEGFIIGGSMAFMVDAPLDEDDTFCSYKKGDINLIVTADAEFYHRFVVAAHIAKSLNLLNKDERIMLFQGMLYGEMV